ncbi:MAG TPA: 50S ribosomal protein L10 [Solirubrobacteraceae bacterium]|jgi:large subunit ribosomal protein L10|nr:50S ribosomal protein L10 [Solirubrobacteraceae bacterium]
MNRDEKAAVIEEVAGEISSAQAVFAVDYRGITVAQVKDLRVRLADSNTQLRVVKNSLTERAAEQAGAPELKSLLVGPTALAFVRGDAALAAKALSDAGRALRLLEFKGGLMDGAPLSAAEVQTIARLPGREVLHAQLVGTIASPLSGLVRGLNALVGGLAIQLGAIADQGLVGGSSASPAEPASEAAAPDSATEADSPGEAEPTTAAEAEINSETEQPEGEAASDAAESDA